MSRLSEHEIHRLQGGPARGKQYQFECPGCGCLHAFDVRTDDHRPNWAFNGDMARPTFSPSLHYPGRCHLFLVDGVLHFLPDCSHHLAGQAVPLDAP